VGDTWKKFGTDEKIEVPELKVKFIDYQEPKKVDKLTESQETISKVEAVMHENIEKMLANQGNVEELILKSKDFSEQSKMFYKQSKKMNRCCELI